MKKTLVVEDDFTSRMLLDEILKKYGPVHDVGNGREAVDAVRKAMESGNPYDLICLDIMMPEMDGIEALKEIRAMEKARRIPPPQTAVIFMITAMGDLKTVIQAQNGSDAYLLKPIEKAKLLEKLREFVLVG